jgi:hypothetical protein
MCTRINQRDVFFAEARPAEPQGGLPGGLVNDPCAEAFSGASIMTNRLAKP